MYFKLNPECYLIKGNKKGVILDLINSKVYTLNPEETKILTLAETNNPIQKDSKFLTKLKNLVLGNFYPNPVYIDKLRVGTVTKLEDIKRLNINKAFLEINNECNRNCSYCGHQNTQRTLGCIGCSKWNLSDEPLTLKRWKSIIDELVNLECSNIFIKGGDLTLDWEKTLEILDHAHGKFQNIQITLHQESLSKKIIDDIKDMAHLIIQTDNLRDIKSNFTYLLVLNHHNLHYLNEIQNRNILLDFVIEKNEEKKMEKLPILQKDKIFPVDVYQFFYNLKYHPCMGNTITISNTGDILICPTLREYKFGNIRNEKLHIIFNKKMDEINKLWQLNLDKVQKCTDCEFRYVCMDCRSLEKSLTGQIDGKILCKYNPYQGEWL